MKTIPPTYEIQKPVPPRTLTRKEIELAKLISEATKNQRTITTKFGTVVKRMTLDVLYQTTDGQYFLKIPNRSRKATLERKPAKHRLLNETQAAEWLEKHTD